MSKSVSDILNAAAKRIEDRSKFDRLHTAEKLLTIEPPVRIGCLATDPEAIAWNASGSIIATAGDWDRARDAWLAFRSFVCPDGRSLYSWIMMNDHEAQVTALREAASR